MFGIRYTKTPPTTYVQHYAGSRLKRQGPGLSFFYYAPASTLVAIPLSSTDIPFAFNEVTADFQAVTVQGQMTYRVAEPARLAQLLDFSVDTVRNYRSDDPAKLPERLVHAAQVLARDLIQRLPLREVLTSVERIAAEVLPALRGAEVVKMLGVEILDLSILSLRPTPDMARALEAEAREALQERADQAIYARRNAAVAEERRIKESELQTEIAVEEKRRQVRETQMAAEIAVEERRIALTDIRTANDHKEADSRAYALEATLKHVRDLDWRTLMALSAGGGDPRAMIALAFRELAENAQKIGELNVTPDLLRSLLTAKER